MVVYFSALKTENFKFYCKSFKVKFHLDVISIFFLDGIMFTFVLSVQARIVSGLVMDSLSDLPHLKCRKSLGLVQ